MYSKLLKRVRRHRRMSVLFRQTTQPGFESEPMPASRYVNNAPRTVVVLPSRYEQPAAPISATPIHPNQSTNTAYIDPYTASQINPPPEYQAQNPSPQTAQPIPQRPPAPPRPAPRRQLSRRERHNLEMNALLNILEEEKKKLGITDGVNDSFRANIDRSKKKEKVTRRKPKKRVVAKEDLDKIKPRKPRPERRSGVVYLSEDQKMGLEQVNVPAPEMLPTIDEPKLPETQDVEHNAPVSEDVSLDPVQPFSDRADNLPHIDGLQDNLDQDLQPDLTSELLVDESDHDTTEVKDYKEPVYNPVPLRERNTETDQNVYDILNQVESGQSSDSKIEIVTPKRPRPRIAPRRQPPTQPETAEPKRTVKKMTDVAPPLPTNPTVQKNDEPVSSTPISLPIMGQRVQESRLTEQPQFETSGIDEDHLPSPIDDIGSSIVREPNSQVEFVDQTPLPTQDFVEPPLPVVPQTIDTEPVIPPVLPIESMRSEAPQVPHVELPQSPKQDSPTVTPPTVVPPPTSFAPDVPVMPDLPTAVPQVSQSIPVPPISVSPVGNGSDTTVQRRVNEPSEQSEKPVIQNTPTAVPQTPLSAPVKPQSVVPPVVNTPDITVQREARVPRDVVTPPDRSEPIVPVLDSTSETAVPHVVDEIPEPKPVPAPVQRQVQQDESPITFEDTTVEMGETTGVPPMIVPPTVGNTPPMVAKASLSAPAPLTPPPPPVVAPSFSPETAVPRQLDTPMMPPAPIDSAPMSRKAPVSNPIQRRTDSPETAVPRTPKQQPESQSIISDEPVQRSLENELFGPSDVGDYQQQKPPLEDVLPVQHHTDRVRPDLVQGPKDYQEPIYNPVPLRDRNASSDQNVRDILNRVESEKPTGGQIETVTPKRPRPRVSPPVIPPPTVPLPQTDRVDSMQPQDVPEMVETEIGSLPSDLWTMLGETPPTSTNTPPPTIVENPMPERPSPVVPPTLPKPITNIVSSNPPVQNSPVETQPQRGEEPRIVVEDGNPFMPDRLFEELQARVDAPTEVPSPQPLGGQPTVTPPVTGAPQPNLVPTEIGPLPSDLWSAIGETPPSPQAPQPQTPLHTLKPDIAPPLLSAPIIAPQTTAVASPTTNWQSFNQPLVVSTPEPVFSPTVTSTPSDTLVIQRTPVDAVPTTRTPINFTPPTPLGNTPSTGDNDSVVQRKVDNKPLNVTHVLPPRTIQREVSMDTKSEAIEESQSQEQNAMMPPPIDVDELARQVYSELKRRMGRDWERGRGRYL